MLLTRRIIYLSDTVAELMHFERNGISVYCTRSVYSANVVIIFSIFSVNGVMALLFNRFCLRMTTELFIGSCSSYPSPPTNVLKVYFQQIYTLTLVIFLVIYFTSLCLHYVEIIGTSTRNASLTARCVYP